MTIQLKRVYEPPSEDDGYRILVERLWPRGISKERAKIDLWVKNAGASSELLKWFGHDPQKWEEFRNRYRQEIQDRPEVLQLLEKTLQEKKVVTFVYAAHDESHNNAVALKEFLEERLKEK